MGKMIKWLALSAALVCGSVTVIHLVTGNYFWALLTGILTVVNIFNFKTLD
jgi:hypothetical protein